MTKIFSSFVLQQSVLCIFFIVFTVLIGKVTEVTPVVNSKGNVLPTIISIFTVVVLVPTVILFLLLKLSPARAKPNLILFFSPLLFIIIPVVFFEILAWLLPDQSNDWGGVPYLIVVLIPSFLITLINSFKTARIIKKEFQHV